MEKTGGKFILQWETHSKQLSRGLSMLMERQCLVDIAVCCGSNTMHAHKCILAANSSYFKEHLENKAIEQVIINGLDFSVMKAVVEFMYCGECVVAENHLRHFIAAVKLFKVTALENIFAESEYQSIAADEVCIPPPQFICKPPKYPTVYKPFNNAPLSPKVNYALNNAYNQHKFKRKCLGTEAEKACAKEAQASRIALANLRKVMANTPQVHSFIVEESFNETTVENFIPSADENYSDNLHDVQFVNGNNAQTHPSTKGLSMIPVSLSGANSGLTADKIKHILGNDEVEIMFQTSDGNFVNVSDEVLLNLSKSGLQYQVVDENGQVGELQELKSLDSETTANKAEDSEGFHEKSALKSGQTFEMKISKNPAQEVEKIAKSMNEEYVSSNFETAICNKNGLDPLQLQSNFNEGLYENGFHMQSTEMFEPENLSMHSDLIDHSMGFSTVNELKYKYIPSKPPSSNEVIDLEDSPVDSPLHENRDVDGKNLSEPSSALKFTPDMFFADLPGNDCTGDKAKTNE